MLSDKVVLVTGGSGTIGRAIVAHAAASGALVVNADLKPAAGQDVPFLSCDVTDESSVRHVVDTLLETQGRIDGLVNCAYPRTDDWAAPFEAVSLASWRRNVEMQLDSVFVCCQHALRHMKAQQRGSIVNIGSIYSVVGPDFNVYDGTDLTTPAAYPAIKGGVVNFTRYLASLFGPAGVRVNCVSPGGIFNHQPERFVAQYARNVPLQRMGRPEDVAPAVSFLLSEGAAYITGHNLLVDGGWTCK